MDGLGQIVIAEVSDKTDGTPTGIRGTINTGHLAGNEIDIDYHGNPDLLKANAGIVVRLDSSPKSIKPVLGVNDSVGYFITSEVPKEFDFAQSSEVIL